MKIEVSLRKRYFLGLVLIVLVAMGVVGVVAFNLGVTSTSGNPAAFGHSVDEMDWSATIQKNVSAAGFCLNGVCKTAWEQISGTSGTTSGTPLTCRISSAQVRKSASESDIYCDGVGEFVTGGGCTFRPLQDHQGGSFGITIIDDITEISSYPLNATAWKCKIDDERAPNGEIQQGYAVCCKGGG